MKKKILAMIIVLVVAILLVVYLIARTSSDQSKPKTESRVTKQTEQPNNNVEEFNKAKFSTSDPASLWVVVNKKRPLDPMLFSPNDLVNVGGQQMRSQAAAALVQMMAAAKEQGLRLVPLSGYRSYNTQVSVYSNEVKRYGQTVADTQSAKPGYSEHQTGLAIDIGGGGCGIEDCFGNTREGKWVAAFAHQYGFIVRYTAGKQEITGYRPEPWHIRYVGTELSNQMHKESITTLEEFFEL